MQDSQRNRNIEWYLNQPTDLQLNIFSHYIEMMKIMANQLMEKEVKSKAGEYYSREDQLEGRYSRWGVNPGSIRIGEEKVRIKVPRILDRHTNRTHSPEIYKQLKAEMPTEAVMKKVILGLSQKDYKEVIQSGLDSFGLSQSSVSRAFIEQTSKELESFENRDLGYYDFVGFVIDGKHLARYKIVIAMGITSTGHKIPLGFIQACSENKQAVKGLLENLIRRNFRFEQGLLVVVDGAKGLSSAVKEVFSGYVVIQRCQWHKRENVISYLNEKDKEYFRNRLQNAYNIPDYHLAKAALMEILNELKKINRSAANSLSEGLEETLTMHRLGYAEMGNSFKTTNTIENLNNLIAKYSKKVKRWHNTDMIMRWMAASLNYAEKRMRRVDNYEKLHLLSTAIKTELKISQEMVA